MKRFVFILFTFISCYTFSADTLTRAEVYDFSIGDTFDYRIDWSLNLSGTYYYRRIVTNYSYSQNNDTLFIEYNGNNVAPNIEYMTLDGLNQFEVFADTATNFCTINGANLDSVNSILGKLQNSVELSCPDEFKNLVYVKGLGITHETIHIDEGGSTILNLIYYSKNGGSQQWGYPLYNTAHLASFTPLPEECATWTSYLYSDTWQQNLAVIEQIKSGNKINHDGHVFVEMIYRSYDLRSDEFENDSIIGYYRNDTMSKKVLFYRSITSIPYFEYDFSFTCAAPNCMDKVRVGNELKTRWRWYVPYSHIVTGQIEGIGGLGGLIEVKSVHNQLGPTSPVLACFSVCGEVLYPNQATGDCELLTSIEDLRSQLNVSLTPTINNGQFSVNLPSNKQGQLSIYNVSGKLMELVNISSEKSNINLTHVLPGMYLWMVEVDGQTSSGKMIIQ